MSKKKKEALDLNQLQASANWLTSRLRIQPVDVQTMKVLKECTECGYPLCPECGQCHIMHCSQFAEMQEICGEND